MKSKRWDDHYARRAKKEQWLARSVYKLQEIDKKTNLIHKGDRILDLGCYPGSWSQYGLRKVGPKGEVVGIDMIPPDRIASSNFRFIKADVLTLDKERLRKEITPRDLVMSDLAPPTTGIPATDTSRSVALATRALEIALGLLKKKGHFVCKVFEGEDLTAFKSVASLHFRQIRLLRPKATRKQSREIYLIGLSLVES